MEIAFDIISNLNLSENDSFNWENKATSLYCIVSGNISSELSVVNQTLRHLSEHYSTGLYIPGHLEYSDIERIDDREVEIFKLCRKLNSVVYLHNQVAIIDGIAVLAVSGWYENHEHSDIVENYNIKLNNKASDIVYLQNSIGRLQLHMDVKTILLVTHGTPMGKLFFGRPCPRIVEEVEMSYVLHVDSENKVKHWIFGDAEDMVDLTVDGINYISNPRNNKHPYWAKRIELDLR